MDDDVEIRYFLCKRNGRWRVYDSWMSWVDEFDSLEDAHTWAMQSAAADVIFAPGGLTRLKAMLRLESAWRIDAEYRQRIAEARLSEIRRQACMTN